MLEKDKIQFFDISSLKETPDFEEHCNSTYIQNELEKRIPNMQFQVLSASINRTGKYVSKEAAWIKLLGGDNTIHNLPVYVEVEVEVSTGKHKQTIIIWSPIAWNDRFAGTAGGGTCTGGREQINTPENTNRGWTMGYALLNGFTVATTDSGNHGNCDKWGIDKTTGELDWERIENWRSRGTHNMTIFGKTVAEILHNRPVKFAYMNGASGGGRQAIVEAQDYPNDYDGIWGSCPAINWTQFLVAGLWAPAVMNEYNHILSYHKLNAFRDAVHASVGGYDTYYRLEKKVDFDASSLIGLSTKDGSITDLDCKIMDEIWHGPHRVNGEFLWYSYYPGGTFWNKIIPIGAFYYPLFGKKPKPFAVVDMFVGLAYKNPKKDFSYIKIKDFEEIFDHCMEVFGHAAGNNIDLRPFAEAGGKLLIDHGLDDPLIPVEGTIDYYRRMCEFFGSESTVNEFCHLYINPGDGHGNCHTNGPGLTMSTGLQALMNWVEHGIAPNELPAVLVNRKTGETIHESTVKPYHL